MIISCIMSGLGNQLFQYANGRAASLENNSDFFLDTRWYYDKEIFGDVQAASRMFLLDKFNIKSQIWKDFAMPNLFEYNSDCRFHDKTFFNIKDNTYIYCTAQSWKNFDKYKNQIKQEFTVLEKLNDKNNEMLDIIKKQTNSVAIHIRRGDKAHNSNVHKIHGLCALEYYEQAYDILRDKYGQLTCFVFSDDIEWAKDNLNIDSELYFVEHNKKEEESVFDLTLMSACKHHIICNSSFSWWGSYLSNNTGTTIAPDFWAKSMDFNLQDIYLADWIILKTA